MRFISKYSKLVVYQGDKAIRFQMGAYDTEDKEEIDAIKKCDEFGKTLFEAKKEPIEKPKKNKEE
jgi:hypothetical protein